MPAFASLNDLPVTRASITLPRRGAWHARLWLDAEQAPEGAVVLATNEGAVTFRGTVVRGAEVHGHVELLIVAGAAGLGDELPPRTYRNISARLVAEDLLREAGEALSAATSSTLLERTLLHWVRLGGATSEGLNRLAEAIGASWRLDLGGQVLLQAPGAPTASPSTGLQLDAAPGEAFRLYALDRLDLEPGTAFDGGVVTQVEHEIRAERIRSRVWFA